MWFVMSFLGQIPNFYRKFVLVAPLTSAPANLKRTHQEGPSITNSEVNFQIKILFDLKNTKVSQ